MEVITTIKWIIAMCEKYRVQAILVKLDIKKAFDRLDRATLMWILEYYGLATEDELRIIAFLISEITLRVKLGSIFGEIFSSNTGMPQGDALSAILFLIYLEHILREHAAREPRLLAQRDYTFSYSDDHNRVKKSFLRRAMQRRRREKRRKPLRDYTLKSADVKSVLLK